jgi:hypothetical protein
VGIYSFKAPLDICNISRTGALSNHVARAVRVGAM